MRRTSELGIFRVHGAAFEFIDGFPIHKASHVGVVDKLDFLDFIGCPEAVKKMNKRQAGPDAGQMGHKSEIHHLLDGCGCDLGKPRLADGIDVGVIAKDGKGMGSDSPGRDVEDRRHDLARNLVHVGDH